MANDRVQKSFSEVYTLILQHIGHKSSTRFPDTSHIDCLHNKTSIPPVIHITFGSCLYSVHALAGDTLFDKSCGNDNATLIVANKIKKEKCRRIWKLDDNDCTMK